MSRDTPHLLASCLGLLLLIAPLVTIVEAAPNAGDEVEQKLAEAYLAVRDAERAGANVTALVDELQQLLPLVDVAVKELQHGVVTTKEFLFLRCELLISEADSQRTAATGAATWQSLRTLGAILLLSLLAGALTYYFDSRSPHSGTFVTERRG